MVFFVGNGITTKVASIGATAITKNVTGVKSGNRQVYVVAKSIDLVVKFGNSSSVTADNSYTSDDLAAGNLFVPAGSIQVFTVPEDVTHVSAICEDGSSTGGALWVLPGYGE